MKRQDIVQAIELLTQIYEGGTPWTDGLADEKTRLATWLRQFDTGDYIDVQPNNSGYGYLAGLDIDGRHRTRNCEDWTQLAELALARRQLVAISAGLDQWAAHITRRLTAAGVTVIDDR